MNRLSHLYSFGYERQFVDVKIKHSCKGPYLTDPTFYVPSTEEGKVTSTYDCFNCCYDDYKVPTALVDLRRPGNDISESTELVSILQNDFDEKMAVSKSELNEQAEAFNKLNSDSQTRQDFIDNLMQNSDSSSNT